MVNWSATVSQYLRYVHRKFKINKKNFVIEVVLKS
jgi:hypothetical protein